MKELIEQEAWKRHEGGLIIDAACRSQFKAGAEWMATLYSCTPDEVKEKDEMLSALSEYLKTHTKLRAIERALINRIEKLLNKE